MNFATAFFRERVQVAGFASGPRRPDGGVEDVAGLFGPGRYLPCRVLLEGQAPAAEFRMFAQQCSSDNAAGPGQFVVDPCLHAALSDLRQRAPVEFEVFVREIFDEQAV
jgi:hypothetical protein